MNRLGTLDYTCENEECKYEILLEIDYTPYISAQVSGPPESCYPEEGGEFQIIKNECCPKCGTKVTEDKARDRFFEKIADKTYDDYERDYND